MPELNGAPQEERVLLLAPTPKDGERSRAILEDAGVASLPCPDIAALCRELADGAGAAILTEEALADDAAGCLADALTSQPAWSDLPLILLTGGGADSPVALSALETLGNVTLLERPVRVATLVSAARAALRARRRQYQVRDHVAERERVAEALREADRRKDEFLAMLAHELRNPLAPVRNATQVLRLKCGDDPVVNHVGQMLERQVAHMVRLVDDLLDVSRVSRGKIELKRESVELGAVITRAVESVRPQLDERQHRLDVSLPGEPLRLLADPARLEQVLTNLLTNAAKYMEPGGRIGLTVHREKADAVLRVSDTGIGIRAALLPRVFDIFQQGDRLPGRVSEGLGLGLTLVKRLTEMHGGTVAVRSEGPGRGSEFTVRLPLAAGEATPEGAPAGGSVGSGRPLRVLLVDDNVDGAESLAVLLRMDRHEVRVTHDGPSALEAAAAFVPQAVFLDVGLPDGMDGYEVARRLRSLPGMGRTLLVALTGYGREEDRRRSREAGIHEHVVKPADPAALRELLARHSA
jgi:signal transduction histidine kinase